MLKRGSYVEVTIRGHVEQDGEDFLVISSHHEPMAHHLTHISKLEIRQGMGEIKNVTAIAAGDDIITTAGFRGTVIFIDDDAAFIKIDEPANSFRSSHIAEDVKTLRRNT